MLPTGKNIGILSNDISDHFPIFHIQSMKSKSIKKEYFSLKQIVNDRTISYLKSELSNQNWSNVRESTDVNIAYGNFKQQFETCYRKCIPVKQIKHRQLQTMGYKLLVEIY